MGILSFTDRQAKKESPPTKISPQVLTLMNLTQEDIDSHSRTIIQKEAIEEGAKYYKEVKDQQDITTAPPVKLGEIALNPNVADKSDLVDSIKDQIGKLQTALHPEDLARINTYLEGFAQGFSSSALENSDWQTAIKATDTVTTGGIINNPELIKKLNELYASDKETRIQIVQLIQTRLDKKTQGSEQKQTAQPEPTPIKQPETPTPQPIQPEPYKYPAADSISPKIMPLTPAGTQPSTPPINLAQNPQQPTTDTNGLVLRPVPPPPNY